MSHACRLLQLAAPGLGRLLSPEEDLGDCWPQLCQPSLAYIASFGVPAGRVLERLDTCQGQQSTTDMQPMLFWHVPT